MREQLTGRVLACAIVVALLGIMSASVRLTSSDHSPITAARAPTQPSSGSGSTSTSTSATLPPVTLPGGDGPTIPSGSAQSPEPPPAGSTGFEGEDTDPDQARSDPSANDGQYVTDTAIAVYPSLPNGLYTLSARLRALQGARADIGINGQMIGSYALGADWRVITAVGHVNDPSESITVSAVNANGSPSALPIDVDWLAVGGAPATMTVRGPQMINPDGSQFAARGVNLPGYFTTAKSSNGSLMFPAPQGEYVQPWGVAVGRISITQEQWYANCPSQAGGQQTSYRQALHNDVADLTARGVVAVLTLSIVERNTATGCDLATDPLKQMADQRSIGMWQAIANEFKGNPLVAFDIYNEPHDIDDATWRNGGTVTYQPGTLVKKAKTYEASGMQTMYDAIRAVGATNLIFVSGQRWSTDPRVLLTSPLDGYGIVAASHSYCFCDQNNPHLDSDIDTFNSPQVRSRFPLVLTEAGWRGDDDSKYNRMLIDWADSRGVGWMVFAFIQPGQYSLVSSWNATFSAGNGAYTKPPSKEGAPVWNSLADQRTARGYAANLVPE